MNNTTTFSFHLFYRLNSFKGANRKIACLLFINADNLLVISSSVFQNYQTII